MVFRHTSLSLSEWWYWYVQGEISLGTSIWRASLERVRKLVTYWSGATSWASLAQSAQAADWWSASLVVSATEHGSKHANTYCVDSCFGEVKLVDCPIYVFLCSFRQTVCQHRLGRGPHWQFCKSIHPRQSPTNLLALRCLPPYAFADGQHQWGTYSAFAFRCCLCQRGCTKSKPIRICCSYLLSIVLMVPWRDVTGWLQWQCIVRERV